MKTQQIVRKALEIHTVIPAFNVPFIPMVKPVAEAIRDEKAVAMIQCARPEWEKFGAISPERVAEEYFKYKNDFTLLHLDHIPVIDEDHKQVDYLDLIRRAIKAGFQSVMVDGSRLSLAENIRCTGEVAALAHEADIPCEAELGAVMGHESGPMKSYEEIFQSKLGFTDVEQAVEFVKGSHCDWLSVAVGSVHGAIAESTRDQKKPTARLDIERIEQLEKALGIPLVLHGGSGIDNDYILRGIRAGIAKINVGTELRQCYEHALREKAEDTEYAREKLYLRTRELMRDFYHISGDAEALKG